MYKMAARKAWRPAYKLAFDPRRGASGPTTSATDWYFATLGLAGTPWADVSRTGLGTRVDSAGLVGFGPHNVALNSKLAGAAAGSPGTAPTSWSLSFSGGSLALGSADADGNVPITFSATNARQVISQVVTAAANTTYRVTVRVASPSAGLVLVQALQVVSLPSGASVRYEKNGAPALNTSVLVDGDSISIIVAVAATSGVFDWRLGCGCNSATTGSESCTLSKPAFTVGAAAVDYIPTTTAARYLPRITHDPVTLSALGLLVEGQATNLYPVSDTPSTRTVTVTAAAHTLSVYGTCTITLSGAATGTLTATGAANIRTTLTFTPSAGSLTMTVSGLTTGNRAQLETGSVATSYIPNPGTGSAVRVADWTGPGVALTGAALAAAFPAGYGVNTVVVRFTSVGGNSYKALIALSAGSSYGTGNGFLVYLADSQVTAGGNNSASALTGALVLDGVTENRVAVSWNTGSTVLKLSVNGAAEVTLNTFDFTGVGTTTLILGANTTGGGASIVTPIIYRSVRVLPGQYITGAALQALTA